MLKQHDKMQQELINIVGHELRAPSQSILGYTEPAKTDHEYTDKPFIDGIYRNCRRLYRHFEYLAR